MSREQGILELKKLLTGILDKNVRTIREGEVVASGIFTYDENEDVYVSHRGEKLRGDEFQLILSRVPMKNGVLVIDNAKEKEKIFADMKNVEVRDLINSYKTSLFRYIDRIISYAVIEGYEEVIINHKAFGRDTYGNVKRLQSLDAYTSNNMKNFIKDEIIQFTPFVEDENNIEVNISVQGVETRIVYWKNSWSDDVEIFIQLLKPIENIPDKVRNMFKIDCGFILLNRDYSRYLSTLLNDKSPYRRIAYIDMQNMTSDEGNGYHFSLAHTSMEMLRNKEFDVYVINMAKVENYKDLLSLPINKLVILIVPVDSNKKALSQLNLFKNLPLVKTHIVDNLKSVIVEMNNPIKLDEWSRELLNVGTVNLEELLGKLQTPFIIRDSVSGIENIDIKKEIRLVLERAEEIDASNIDICPGSPIRLYKSKLDYVPYSNVKMTPNLTEIMILNMIRPSDIGRLFEEGQLDTSYSVPGVGRYRLGIVLQRSSLAISIRRVPKNIPSPEELLLPRDFVEEVVKIDKGITLIAGEPNSGKTVTFNSLIDEINQKKGGILFLMGNPIEYTHRHSKALVLQIEIGYDLPSYTHGIAKALRMNTTTLGFEELRTQSEFAALSALINAPNAIFMTAHAPSARQAIQNLVNRIHESGISEEKAREDVANALNYVMFQKLVDYKGKRVLLYEKVKATPQIKALIKNGNFNQLDSAIASDKECESFDDEILKRLEDNLLDFETVKSLVTDKSRFRIKGYDI